jgi:histidinol-phosphate aminotransferase
MLFLTNGGDEALTLLAKALLGPGDEAVIPTPTFGAYVFSTRLMDAEPVLIPLNAALAVDLPAMTRAITPRTKLIYVCNPNNPTGLLLSAAEIRSFLSAVPPSVAVVLDEAYAEYVTSPDFLSGVRLLAEYPNVITVRTFSKIYGLAAMRLGYGIAHPDIAAMVQRVRNPFNANFLVQEAALAALADTAFRDRVAAANARERAQLSAALAGFGFAVYPSQTNFVLTDTGRDSAALCQALAQRGIIIRSGHGWGLPRCVRISLGDAAQNERLLAAMAEILTS